MVSKNRMLQAVLALAFGPALVGCHGSQSEPGQVATTRSNLSAGGLSVLPVFVVPRDQAYLIPDPSDPSRALDGSPVDAYNKTVNVPTEVRDASGTVSGSTAPVFFGTHTEVYERARKNLSAGLRTTQLKYQLMIEAATGKDEGTFALSTWNRATGAAEAYNAAGGADIEPLVMVSRYDWATLNMETGDDTPAANPRYYAAAEVIERMGYTASTFPYVMVVVLVSDPLAAYPQIPGAGGRPLFDSFDGGGYLQFSYFDVHNAHVQGTHFLSTLVHEIGHTFGLPHVEDYKTPDEVALKDPPCNTIAVDSRPFFMHCGTSIMSYNSANWIQGCVRSSPAEGTSGGRENNFHCLYEDTNAFRTDVDNLPGELIQEDVRQLARNDAALKDVVYDATRFPGRTTRENGGLGSMPLPVLDRGLEIWLDGEYAYYGPGATDEDARLSCDIIRRMNPGKITGCRFEGHDLGYELFADGERVGFEPTWGRAAAAGNCQVNRDANPEWKVTCRYDGHEIGYERWQDGVRVAFEPTWTRAQAVTDCESSRSSHPGAQIECKYRGRAFGYELFANGRRIGFEPTWPGRLALEQCNWYKGISAEAVSCKHDGVVLGYERFESGPRVAFEPTYGRGGALYWCGKAQEATPGAFITCEHADAELGYELYWGSVRAGFEPKWSKSTGIANCLENQTNSPGGQVSCRFEGRSIGYEVFLDGQRAAFHPDWTRAQALADCESQRDGHPGSEVSCSFEGERLGYELFLDGKRAGYEPKWSRLRGQLNCRWNRDDKPGTRVSCKYAGVSLGYELILDGQRAGFEPLWGREHAAKNCRANRDDRPGVQVTCTYEGTAGLGYEVFVDGARVGFEPTWSRAEAVTACEQKRTSTTAGRVSCRFDGRELGYELLLNGARAGYEPTWTRTEALANCEQNRTNSPGTWVSCRYDGVPLGYEVRVDGARADFQPTWSRIRAAADCKQRKERNPSSVVSCMYEGKVFSLDATTMSVMSFEVPWTCDPATKPTSSDESTSGNVSMRIPNPGWGSCVAPATFRCDQVKLGSTLYLDVKLPPQKNVWYSGEVQLFLDVPSQNKVNQPVARFDLPAQVTLTADQLGRWITVSATALPILAEVLGSGCNDLKLRMTVNPDTAGLLVDTLR